MSEQYGTYFGLAVAGFLVSAVAVFAFAAAVGAVAVDCRNDVSLVFALDTAALSGSFGAGLAAGLADAAGFDTGVAPLEAGAAVEDLVAVGVLGATFGKGLLAGVLLDVEALAVEMVTGFLGSSLPLVVGVPLALALLGVAFGVPTVDSFFAAGVAAVVETGSVLAGSKSSAGGERALPPDTAEASVGSAGLRETSSCAPVVALSGFSAGVSCTGSRLALCSFSGSSSTAASSGVGAFSGWVAPAAVSAEDSGKSEPFMM